jgi:hypothetical protein
MVDAPEITLDTTGQLRLARIKWHNLEATVRVPLHVYKMTPEKMQHAFIEIVAKLKKAFQKKHGRALP